MSSTGRVDPVRRRSRRMPSAARAAPPALTLALALALASAAAVPGRSGEPNLASILDRPILEPGETLSRTRAFLRRRVPEVAVPETAAAWRRQAASIRRRVLEHVIFRGEARRWREAGTRVEWLGVASGVPQTAGYRIRKLRYEAVPGLWIPALLYEPLEIEGRAPLVLNVNGHDVRNGMTAVYKQIRCINQVRRGMIALNLEWLGMGQLRRPGFSHERSNQIDLCGSSGIAVFYLAMARGLDILLAHEHADPDRLAVTGLSGGGWQTIVLSALDERVKLACPVAGYSSNLTRIDNFSDLGDIEQAPADLGAAADYAHLTMLLAPRPALLVFNARDDCCFRADHALAPLLDAARPVYALLGASSKLRSHVNEDPGTHNYEIDNRQALYAFLGEELLASGGADGAGGSPEGAREIPCAGEVLPREDLRVELPAGNADFHTLALALAADLPRASAIPAERAALERWQAEHRRRVAEVLRAPRLPATAVSAAAVRLAAAGAIEATSLRIDVGGDWIVPAVELVRRRTSAAGESIGEDAAESKVSGGGAGRRGTVLLIADGGRRAAAEIARTLLDAGRDVLAVDPYLTGESRIARGEWLWAVLAGSLGERPLGLQAGQVAAIARWLAERDGEAATITASGPLASLIALCAGALEERAIASLDLSGSLASLAEILEADLTMSQAPELFCFGLLEATDILQLAAVVAPRPVRFRLTGAGRGPAGGGRTLLPALARRRMAAELGGLAAVYETFGSAFDPLE